MAFNYDTWAASWGSSWLDSWGVQTAPPAPEPTPEPGAERVGGGGKSGFEPRRIDYQAREQIAVEFREAYREIYEKAAPQGDVADEAAALVAEYTPTSAADFPPPQAVDWEAIADEGRVVILRFRTALLELQTRLVTFERERTALEARLRDDEEAAAVLLLMM